MNHFVNVLKSGEKDAAIGFMVFKFEVNPKAKTWNNMVPYLDVMLETVCKCTDPLFSECVGLLNTYLTEFGKTKISVSKTTIDAWLKSITEEIRTDIEDEETATMLMVQIATYLRHFEVKKADIKGMAFAYRKMMGMICLADAKKELWNEVRQHLAVLEDDDANYDYVCMTLMG